MTRARNLRQQRSKADVEAAALMLVTGSTRPRHEIEASLVKSYGMKAPQAAAFVAKHRPML